MSFLPASLNPYASSSSSSSSNGQRADAQADAKPATLSYFFIYSPALRPRGAGISSEDPSADALQLLFYTSRERAVSQDRMLRQLGLAKGLVEFGAMVGAKHHTHPDPDADADAGDSWSVHSSKRRMVLVELQPSFWAHACILLHHCKHSLSDEWIHQSIRRAWKDWRLLNGTPATLLASVPDGRRALERSLERFFSVWAWSWDLEATSSSTFVDSLPALPVTPSAPRTQLTEIMQSFAASHLSDEELYLVLDTNLLWPPTDAGCFDSDPAAQLPSAPTRQRIHPSDRNAILRKVISHLTGLERERELVRAAAPAARRGTSAAIREKRDSRSAPRSSNASPAESASSTPADIAGGKWWGGMLATIGKGLSLRSGEPGSREITPPPPPPAAQVKNTTEPPEPGSGPTPASGPFQALQQRLAEALPVSEAWSGAETAFKGLGASLGLGTSPSSTDGAASIEQQGQTPEHGEAERKRDSILEPNVDLQGLADAIGESEGEGEGAAQVSGDTADGQGDGTIKTGIADEPPPKAFPSISVTSAAWYSSQPRAPVRKGRTSASSALTPTPDVNVDGDGPHDFTLDGWGDEQPEPFQSFRCFLGGSDEPIALVEPDEVDGDGDGDGDGGHDHPSQFEVLFTTRRLLTAVLVRKDRDTASRSRGPVMDPFSVADSLTRDADPMLKATWELLRRVQRVLNDFARSRSRSQAQAQLAEGEAGELRFLHLDEGTLTYHDRVRLRLLDEADGEAEQHCIEARAARHAGIVETFTRSNAARTWTASKHASSFLILTGRNASITDADSALRRLANTFPSFAL